MSPRIVHLRIAGFVIRVSASDELLESFLVRAGTYAVPAGPADIELHVEDDPAFAPSAPYTATYPAPNGSFSEGRYHFWRRDLEVVGTPGAPTRASGRCQARFGIAVENIVRLCLSTLVPLRGGLMLHASAFEHAGQGFVFTGVSGAGKSTAIRLLEEGEFGRSLGDEVTILALEGDAITVHSTPFGGELAPVPPGQAPLRRLFLLHPTRVFPKEPAFAVARLCRNALAVCPEARLAAAILESAEAIVRRADCRALYRPTRDELLRAMTEE